MQETLDQLLGYREEVMLYGLALVALTAGLSKFVYPGMWAGFEPQWLQSALSFLSATQIMYAVGAIEATAGALLALNFRTREVASIVAVWLLLITVTVASMGAWTIALRDLGLVAVAYGVAADH